MQVYCSLTKAKLTKNSDDIPVNLLHNPVVKTNVSMLPFHQHSCSDIMWKSESFFHVCIIRQCLVDCTGVDSSKQSSMKRCLQCKHRPNVPFMQEMWAKLSIPLLFVIHFGITLPVEIDNIYSCTLFDVVDYSSNSYWNVASCNIFYNQNYIFSIRCCK